MIAANTHEEANRAIRVQRLIATLELLDELPTADDVADWQEETWLILAATAKLKKPASDKTKVLVIDELRERERVQQADEPFRVSL